MSRWSLLKESKRRAGLWGEARCNLLPQYRHLRPQFHHYIITIFEVRFIAIFIFNLSLIIIFLIHDPKNLSPLQSKALLLLTLLLHKEDIFKGGFIDDHREQLGTSAALSSGQFYIFTLQLNISCRSSLFRYQYSFSSNISRSIICLNFFLLHISIFTWLVNKSTS